MGLLIGLIIGLIVSYSQRQKSSDSNYFPITFQSETPKEVEKANKPKTTKKKSKTNRKSTTKPLDSLSIDSNAIITDSLMIDSLLNDSILQLNIDSIGDSIYTTDSLYDEAMYNIEDTLQYTTLNIEPANSDDIHIAKDELIYALYVLPQGLKSDFLCKTKNNRDSLLANNITRNSDDGLYIEFWHSPINYTGYKLSSNTLVLFGVYEYTSIRLKYLPDGLLRLHYHRRSYDLKCTDEFIPLLIKR